MVHAYVGRPFCGPVGPIKKPATFRDERRDMSPADLSGGAAVAPPLRFQLSDQTSELAALHAIGTDFFTAVDHWQQVGFIPAFLQHRGHVFMVDSEGSMGP